MMVISSRWSSHLPVLMKLLSITDGDVLEMGMGLYSTPYLHWACFGKRKLVSFENDEKYIRYNSGFASDLHEIIFVEDWDKTDIEKPWDVALVDHSPGERRIIDIKRLANLAKYIVVHDTEPESEPKHHFSEIYPLFKYRYDFKKYPPRTSVLSNLINLKSLNI